MLAQNLFAIRITSEFMYLNVNMRPSYLHKFLILLRNLLHSQHFATYFFDSTFLYIASDSCIDMAKWENGQVHSTVAQVNCSLTDEFQINGKNHKKNSFREKKNKSWTKNLYARNVIYITWNMCSHQPKSKP